MLLAAEYLIRDCRCSNHDNKNSTLTIQILKFSQKLCAKFRSGSLWNRPEPNFGSVRFPRFQVGQILEPNRGLVPVRFGSQDV